VVPTTLKQIYGKSASSIYGVIFTFTGLANVVIFFIVSSEFGKNYAQVFQLSAIMCTVALVVLLLAFEEKKIYLTQQTNRSALLS